MVVTATDFSARSEKAIERAAAIAKRVGAPLALLHAINPHGFFSHLLEQKKIAPAPDEIKAKLDKKLAAIGVSGEAIVEYGAPCEMIVNYARAKQASLIVLGDHGDFQLRELFVGTTAKNAIDQAKIPVLIVKSGGDGYKRVMIATDFSQCSKDAAAAALQLFGDAEFLVFAAYLAPNDIAASYYGVATHELHQMLEDARAETLSRLEAFVSELPFPQDRVKILARASSYPQETIAETAQSEGCDLLAIGTHGVTTTLSFLIGSTAESLLRKSVVDMLIFKND
ncbi:universal stress protein [Campylobacterota bacterium]|nr:universal stress protein [Campylobacterota bacterium]